MDLTVQSMHSNCTWPSVWRDWYESNSFGSDNAVIKKPPRGLRNFYSDVTRDLEEIIIIDVREETIETPESVATSDIRHDKSILISDEASLIGMGEEVVYIEDSDDDVIPDNVSAVWRKENTGGVKKEINFITFIYICIYLY